MMTLSSRIVGVALVGLVHGSIFVVAALAPSERLETLGATDEMSTCANVVNPACASAGSRRAASPTLAAAAATRRCPEPMHRMRRRQVAPPAPAAVDLLVAELVENFGEVDGDAFDVPTPTKPPSAKTTSRIKQVRKLVGSKLDSILSGGAQGQQRRERLSKILGTSKGRLGGNALISQRGSVYARTLKKTLLSHFRVPGNVPPWLRKSLVCRVKIVTMTATGRVIAFRIVRKSGNPAFDGAVRSLMGGYKAGLRSLPPPPAHILSAINSRGFVIDFR